MTSTKPSGYFVADPRPIEAAGRYTYFIASPEEVAAVGVSDLVQLTFELDPPGKKWSAERMWVKVTEANTNLVGTLESQPEEAPIQRGERIEFRRLDIINIAWSDPDSAPAPPPRREYWDRCLVDACVLEGEEPVEFIYREEPEPQQEEDRYPDSGWCIRGRRGDATDDDMEARAVQQVALGAVLNKDDSWLHLIDAPVGSAFLRNLESGEYVPEGAAEER